jgi:hypothetical protein
VYPDLVGRNPAGQPESVRYDHVNAMLLNEFLKAHKTIEEQLATIMQLKNEIQTIGAQYHKEIQALSAQLKEQAARIQRVSDQFEMTKPTGRLVENRQ